MSLLQTIVDVVNISYVPELIIEYLAGDSCLNHCPTTLDEIFTTIYRDRYGRTYLDPQCTIRHSFNDEPAFMDTIDSEESWYRNGQLHRDNGKPALIMDEGDCTCKKYYNYGKLTKQERKFFY